jgi:hypothetical protein
VVDLVSNVIGEVYVRRQWLAGPRFRYPWAAERTARLAWKTFEEQGWYDLAEDIGEPDMGPPVYLLYIRPTMSPDVFIACYDLGEMAFRDGYLVGAGWVG